MGSKCHAQTQAAKGCISQAWAHAEACARRAARFTGGRVGSRQGRLAHCARPARQQGGVGLLGRRCLSESARNQRRRGHCPWHRTGGCISRFVGGVRSVSGLSHMQTRPLRWRLRAVRPLRGVRRRAIEAWQQAGGALQARTAPLGRGDLFAAARDRGRAKGMLVHDGEDAPSDARRIRAQDPKQVALQQSWEHFRRHKVQTCSCVLGPAP